MAPADEVLGASGGLPDDLLDGRYRLESLLGRGGMAAVYQALDTRLDRRVAIKMLAEGPGADERRFRAEVRTLARFSHPSLVRLLDAGEVDGRLYLVMELVQGTTLAARLRNGSLPASEVAQIGADVAGALAYVHAEGIVHRDIKPANILLAANSSAYLADFGIARLVDTTGMTATGLLIGTPAYLAPEQVNNHEVGAPADVFALGIVLIECLTGERAFTGTLSEIAANRALRDPEVPTDLDGHLTSLLRSMTARTPERRATAPEVAAELSAWQLSAPRHADAGRLDPPATVLAAPATGGTERLGALEPTLAATEVAPHNPRPPRTRSPGEPSITARGRALMLAAAAFVVALLVGLGLGVLLFAPSSSSSRRRDPATGAGSKRTVASSTTTSTTTTLPAPSLATAVGNLVSGLVSGVRAGDVAPQAGQQLMGQLQALSFSSQAGASNQQTGQFDQLVQSFDQDVAKGQITGSQTVSSLTHSIDALAAALDTSVPSATAPLPSPPPNGKKAHGQGNGKGHS